MIDSHHKGDIRVHLIDFGLAKKVSGREGGHKKFSGNFEFASLEQMMLRECSYSDDMKSVLYLMVYLLNDGLFPFLENQTQNF